MKRILLSSSALCVLLAGCISGNWSGTPTIKGSGNVISETRVVSQFDRLLVSGSGRLSIVQDGQESLTIEADDNLLPLIKSEITGGLLKIGPEHVNLHPTKPIQYSLHLKELRELHLSGSLEGAAESIKTDRLALHISGSGKIRIPKLEAADLQVHVSGSGHSEVGGKVSRQNVQISGSGNHNAAGCVSEGAAIHISGSGDATVWARRTLDAHISGSGSVSYYGSPQTTTHVSGSGSMISLGNK